EYFDLHGASNAAFVVAVYQDSLGRQANPAEQAAFEQLLAGGMPRSQVATLILGSAEYQSVLVQADFALVLGRQASAGELAAFVGELQRGFSDQLVLAQLLGSPEAFARRG